LITKADPIIGNYESVYSAIDPPIQYGIALHIHVYRCLLGAAVLDSLKGINHSLKHRQKSLSSWKMRMLDPLREVRFHLTLGSFADENYLERTSPVKIQVRSENKAYDRES
jgi:hypothetical protein